MILRTCLVSASIVWAILASAGAAYATPAAVPEIDGSAAVTALGLLAGVVSLVRERRRQK